MAVANDDASSAASAAVPRAYAASAAGPWYQFDPIDSSDPCFPRAEKRI